VYVPMRMCVLVRLTTLRVCTSVRACVSVCAHAHVCVWVTAKKRCLCVSKDKLRMSEMHACVCMCV
jgi:hypothetical protein